MKNKSISTPEFYPSILSAIHHLLRPLVRLLLQHGIAYQAFCELIKSVYVKVAEQEFKLDAKVQTDSRISLLTGIHRREINRLRNETIKEINLSQHASMKHCCSPSGAVIMNIWILGAYRFLCHVLQRRAGVFPLSRWFNRSAKIYAHAWCWMNGYIRG